jgi:hypothetical protein
LCDDRGFGDPVLVVSPGDVIAAVERIQFDLFKGSLVAKPDELIY